MLKTLTPAIAALCVFSASVLAQGGAKPTDPQIAHIAYTAGLLDIDAGKQALAKSTNKDVRAFAEMMVKDHTAVNKQALDLCKKLGVTPEDNDTSKGLTKQAAAKRAELDKLSGAAFDKAYIAHEVVYHQQVLDAVDKTLIPGAKNAELKALLVKVRPAFVAHLEHAKHLQASLAK